MVRLSEARNSKTLNPAPAHPDRGVGQLSTAQAARGAHDTRLHIHALGELWVFGVQGFGVYLNPE